MLVTIKVMYCSLDNLDENPESGKMVILSTWHDRDHLLFIFHDCLDLVNGHLKKTIVSKTNIDIEFIFM